jgi:hypothetical protein
MSHPLVDDPEGAPFEPAPGPDEPADEPAGETSPNLERWIERGQAALGLFGSKLAGEIGEVRKRVAGGSPVLRQGLAALERGNLEAAFWLLREEVAERPDESAAVQAFWNVSLTCGRAEAAAAPMSRLVQRQATEDPERATESWISLDAEAPEAPVDALTLARLLPVLKARVAAAPGEEGRQEARRWLVRALERCVEPGSGLEGRAAEIALESPNLHEAKRERLEEFVGSRSSRGIAIVRA